MMKKTIAGIAFAVCAAISTTPTFAGSSNANSGASSGSNSGAVINSSKSVEGSVGMGGLPGGRCVNAVQVGVPGVAGVGFSHYQNRCINFEMLRQMWKDGIVTNAEYRKAGLLQARLKFVEAPVTQVHSSKYFAAPAVPKASAPAARTRIVVRVNGTRYVLRDKTAAAWDSCKQLNFAGVIASKASCGS